MAWLFDDEREREISRKKKQTKTKAILSIHIGFGRSEKPRKETKNKEDMKDQIR